MTNLWDADVTLSIEDARQKIERQFPLLAPVQVEPLGVGWDNIALVVNGQYVFRLPRRKIAAALIATESFALPLLAPRLPLPIPVPQFVGTPDSDYPYPFLGYALLPGTTACRGALTEVERARNAPVLARFLAALHAVPVDDTTRAIAPGDDIERTNLPKRAEKAKERLHTLKARLAALNLSLASLLELTDRLALTPPWTKPTCWVHGDLYARHLLVDESRALCGVIDWGDVHLGDPALDLSIAFTFLPVSAHAAFREAYGTIEEATWARARFRAIHYSAILMLYGDDIGDRAIAEIGEFALQQVLHEHP